jgi:hypothetical protein
LPSNYRLLQGFDNGIELPISRNRLLQQLKRFATFAAPYPATTLAP